MSRLAFALTFATCGSAYVQTSEQGVATDVRPEALVNASLAELNEGGYAEVAALESNSEMEKYMLRAIEQQGFSVADDSHFKDVVPYYSGSCATQSYEALYEEIQKGEHPTKCQDAWLARGHSRRALRRIAARQSTGLMSSLYNFFFGPKTTTQAINALQESIFGGNHIGMFAAIDELGYLAVATSDDQHEMFLFVRRVLKDEGLVVTKLKMLERMLPYYDGTCDIQSLSAMVAELRHATHQKKTCFGGPWVEKV